VPICLRVKFHLPLVSQRTCLNLLVSEWNFTYRWSHSEPAWTSCSQSEISPTVGLTASLLEPLGLRVKFHLPLVSQRTCLKLLVSEWNFTFRWSHSDPAWTSWSQSDISCASVIRVKLNKPLDLTAKAHVAPNRFQWWFSYISNYVLSYIINTTRYRGVFHFNYSYLFRQEISKLENCGECCTSFRPVSNKGWKRLEPG
jgi:hypothetical protein